MVEIEILIYKKLKYYQDQFAYAESSNLNAHKKHYKKCLDKLDKLLSVLNEKDISKTEVCF